jgi:hypothetical protein
MAVLNAVSGVFPNSTRTYPAAASNCRRAIHKFDKANSACSRAVFFA